MKITRKQLTKIIAEELVMTGPVADPAGGPVVMQAPDGTDHELPAASGKDALKEKAIRESLAGSLLAIADDNRKAAVVGFTKKVGDAPYALLSKVVEDMCDKVSQWEKWGAHQNAANKVCRIGGKIVAGGMTGGIKVAWNAISLALSLIPAEMINDFAADSYPDTVAGKIALKKKTARLEAEKKAKAKPRSSARSRRAVKESIREIVRNEILKGS